MKKTIVTLTALLAFSFLFSGSIFAQEKEKDSKTETIRIKSSVVCGMCEERVKKEMAFEKGVKDVKVDLDTKIITITYKSNKTDKETLKKAITKIGYDADDLMADETAYGKLPACCKKDATPH